MFAPLLGQFVPAVELKETDEKVIVRVEVPGVRKNDLDIDVTGNQVTIRGKRRSEKRARDPTYYHRESLYGVFSRVIRLPLEVVPDRAVAKLESGILTLILPKAEPPRNKFTRGSAQ
jgi:HSP20 family protein